MIWCLLSEMVLGYSSVDAIKHFGSNFRSSVGCCELGGTPDVLCMYVYEVEHDEHVVCQCLPDVACWRFAEDLSAAMLKEPSN